jgi:hypothetical protein
MMPKLTILATLPFVLFSQEAGAATLARCVRPVQRFAVRDLATCGGADILDRRLETGSAPNALYGSFPLSVGRVQVSMVSAVEETDPGDWNVFAWALEPGDGAKLDYSILRFHHADDSTFTATYPSLRFRHADDSTFTTDYSISSFSRVSYSTFTTPEFFALDARTVSSLASESFDWPLTAVDEVQPEVTLLSGNDAAKALSRAWKRARRQLPSLDLLVVLTAHWAHETAAGTSMFNYNFGGIKGRGPSGLSCLRGAREGFGFRTRVSRDRFRAYPNVASGADDYLSLLLRKYPLAIEAAERGEVIEFVQALHDGGYFTGSEHDYELSLLKYTIPAQDWALSALGGIRPIEIPSLTALADPTPSP